MKKRIFALLLTLALVLSLAGCGDTVGKIAGNVADAALEELKNQIKLTLEENKLKVVEMETAFGNLNGDGQYQFFCAALIQSDATMIPQSTADTLAKVFTEASLAAQSTQAIHSPYLVHKDLSFDHSDFSQGNYYIIYAYHEDISSTLPTLSPAK